MALQINVHILHEIDCLEEIQLVRNTHKLLVVNRLALHLPRKCRSAFIPNHLIPEGIKIQILSILFEFIINNNQLKKLPDSICKLKQLEILNVSHNCLKELPNDIGDLTSLKMLNIQNNCKLNKLPKSICKATKLQVLELEKELFLYPPREIIENGLNAIMQFIADECGFIYEPSADIEENQTNIKSEIESRDEEFKAKIWELQKIKQRKMQNFLDIEKANEELQRQELELSNAQKINKQKLLEYITEEQNRLDSELSKIQIERETERFKLIEQLMDVELKADRAIKKLLLANREPLEQLLQQEKLEEERMLSVVNNYNGEFHKNDILEEMQKILQQETEKFKQFHKSRIETSQSILKQEMETDAKLCQVLQDQDLHKTSLISQLQEDNDLQKAAVAALLERGDARSWGIMQQVRLVEMQLAALTTIEMDKKKLEVDQQISDLAQKRADLSNLLVELLEQQKQRRTQLILTLQSLETSNNSLDNFWLMQYQQLLQKLPVGLSTAQKNINPQLSEALLLNGVIHCLPFLAKLTQSECDITKIKDDDLLAAGVLSQSEREKILDSFQMYFKEMKLSGEEDSILPSAPPILLEEASAPIPSTIKSINYSECVVCMDAECDIIFVPCGHLCCCPSCAIPIVACPLCRSDIERKITKLI